MAKGYYVIPTNEDMVEYEGRGAYQKALKDAKERYAKGDKDVFIQQFNDDDCDGFCANGKTIFIDRLLKGQHNG